MKKLNKFFALTLALARNPENCITVVSRRRASFADVEAILEY